MAYGDDESSSYGEERCTTIVVPARVACWLEIDGDFSRLLANPDLENVEISIELTGGERLWFSHWQVDHPREDYDTDD